MGGNSGVRNLHSLPAYYGFYTALWAGLPALLIAGLWVFFEGSLITSMVVQSLPALRDDPARAVGSAGQRHHQPGQRQYRVDPGGCRPAARRRPHERVAHDRPSALAVVVLSIALAAGSLAWRAIGPKMRARNRVERIVSSLLIGSSLHRHIDHGRHRAFRVVRILPFLSEDSGHGLPVRSGMESAGRPACRPGRRDRRFGSMPLFAGTLLISFIALLVAVPIGLMAAIYLADYARPQLRSFQTVLEVLAGMPTVVYGFFAALTLAPAIRGAGGRWGWTCHRRVHWRPAW